MLIGRNQDGFVYVFERPTRLLVVDDDPLLREISATQLAHPGGDIVTAQDGEEALAILQREPPFDLVLSDLEMPRMTGFGLIEAMRADPRLAHVPVVVVTSRDDMFAIDRAYEVGATSFVTKPVNWRLLGYQLRYVLRAARSEAEVREAREVAERADRLKESLLALLQHETRTPLNALVGYGELIAATASASGEARGYAETLVEAARGLDDTLRRVFAFARLSSGSDPLSLEPITAESLIEDAAHRRANAARAAGVSLLAEPVPPGAGRVHVDAGLIARALDELVANALAHAGAGGRVALSVAEDGDRVEIAVRDTGPGLDEEGLARCMEPFWQGEAPLVRRSAGLGLGLATARCIAQAHGGRLEIASAPRAERSAEGGADGSRGLLARIVLPAANAVEAGGALGRGGPGTAAA